MPEFLSERLPVDVRMGASYADEYAVEITTTAGGAEYRRLIHGFPARRFTINYTLLRDDLAARVLALYHRAYGKFAGFRVRCADDFSTNAHTGAPTATDWVLPKISNGVYQLIKGYGSGATPLGIGLPYRNLYKPVSGTVLVSKNDVTLSSGVSVDYTTGRVTITPAPTSEVIKAGCEFDLPCRFNSSIEITALSKSMRDCGSIDIIELLQP
ncbi:DUF2460 domain-containing protein [Candidatus Accumulibacter sp. ACC012]|uniref:DUF2460 domain-containing protein n=1 Tax=Candidatus Accumulibacter sp. ACC012 TaxID=2823332 RepID=UPI0025BF6F9F|nr:DUF2460 domain-containing protein [Candidatus Accumulibacter sp. ACC012]